MGSASLIKCKCPCLQFSGLMERTRHEGAGKPYGLSTVVDKRLAECQTIVFGAGAHRESIRMDCRDYPRLAEPKVADIAVHL